MIRITSKKDGFRRAGIAHSKEPTEYQDDRFSKAELKQLKAEPNLTVEICADKKIDPPKPNVPDTVKLVEAADTLEALNVLAEGETRKGVLEAIAKRGDELEAAAAEKK